MNIKTEHLKDVDMNALQLKQRIDGLLQNRKYDSIKALLLSYKAITEKDNDLATICYLCTIYEQEKVSGCAVIFSKVSNIDELLERYTRLKFYLRRIEFDVIGNQLETFFEFLTKNQISACELLQVIDFSIVNKEKVLKVIRNEMDSIDVLSISRMGRTVDIEFSDQQSESRSEICFIICTNNQLYAQECIYYIKQLHVPEGVCIDILTVEDAKSMTAGYNEAMQYSKAKYKVYLHHDTFIVYPYFIQDLLRIFRSDETIGMVGVIGAPRIPKNGIMWDGQRYGMIYEQHIYETVMLSNPCKRLLEEVEAIDGLLMATQYDIPWREDLFDKWDFYDCSQSMEFIQHGYRVVVPQTELPWCLHDCGFLNLDNYDEERKKFVEEYLVDKGSRTNLYE